MGGFLIPNTTINGGVANPGIPFHDSPDGGLYETPNGGVGISLAGGTFFELDQKSFNLGYRKQNPFAISAVAGSPFVSGTNPSQCVVSPDGTKFFAVNVNTGNVSVYYRNSTTGALTPVTGSPFATGASGKSIAISPNGAFLFVGSAGGNTLVAVFSIDATTGALAAVAGSPFATTVNNIASMAVTPNGNWLITIGTSNSSISTNAISAAGVLTVGGAQFTQLDNPWGVAITPDGLNIYLASNSGDVLYGFSINEGSGVLAAIAGSPFVVGVNPSYVAVTPNGDFVLVTNSTSNTVSIFARNATTGALTPVAGSPFATGGQPEGIMVSPDGNYVYIACYTASQLDVFSLSSTGILAAVAGSPFAVGVDPNFVAISPDGNSVYVANYGANNISAFETSIQTFNLVTALFDTAGGLYGSFNINGLLQIAGQMVLNQVYADARYAALAGLTTQPFSAKTLTLDNAAGGLEGTTTNDNAIAGMVGEYIADVVATPGVALATGVVSNVGSIALTAGDWDVDGVVDFLPAATTSITQLLFGISSATGVLGGQDSYGQLSSAAQVPAANIVQRTPTVRLSLAANTTVYLVAEGVFTVSTLSAFGTIRARRVR